MKGKACVISAAWAHGLLAAAAAFSVATVLAGLDFGSHWDEWHILESVDRTLATGRLLPGWYNYPSVSYALALATAAPGHADATGLRIRTRAVFAIASMLSIAWVYLASLRWRGRRLEALVGALLVAFSWQVTYHARWIAPDAILMQFAALSLFALLPRLDSRDGTSTTRLWWAAVVAGLAAGTKYPGALLAMFGVLQGWLGLRAQPTSRRLRECAFFACIAGAVFIATTPGLVFEPAVVWNDVLFEAEHYRTGHWGYTVAPGLEHFRRMATYIALSLFAHSPVIAACVFAAAVLGAIATVRERSPAVLPLIVLPAVYITYMAIQHVMIVRNVLIVAPFLAVLAARGLEWARERVPARRGLDAALLAAVALGLAVEATWIAHAAASVREQALTTQAARFDVWIRAHEGERVAVSPRIYRDLAFSPGGVPVNVSRTVEGAARAAFYLSDAPRRITLPANERGRYEALPWGPFDIDLDYYPTWENNQRIVLTSPEFAQSVGAIR